MRPSRPLEASPVGDNDDDDDDEGDAKGKEDDGDVDRGGGEEEEEEEEKAKVSTSSWGANTNLLNLASIDHQLFYQQQQQNQQRAERQRLGRPVCYPSESPAAPKSQLSSDSLAYDTQQQQQSLSSEFNLWQLGEHLEQQQQQQPPTGQQQQQVISRAPQVQPFVLGHGHYFVKKTFHKPTYCHHCADMLWGLIGQGYTCDVCNFVVHERCVKRVAACCSTVASSAIGHPMAHCWLDVHNLKLRRFCNVCRKRIDENAAASRCGVCECSVHPECLEFSLSDCRDCATHTPNITGSQSRVAQQQQHHWREGNLPPTASKCSWCRKSCYSAECLTGMRCEWCQATAHAGCVAKLSPDCNLGPLQSIMLPPSCVSVPRSDIPLETILGVQQAIPTTTTTATTTSNSQATSTPSSGAGAGGSSLSPAVVSSCYSTSSSSSSSSGVCSSSSSFPCSPTLMVTATGAAVTGSRRENPTTRTLTDDATHLQQQVDEMMSAKDKDEEMVRVFDGNNALRKRSFRLVCAHRAAPRDALVAQCLRAFHIHDDVGQYALHEVVGDQLQVSERELDDQQHAVVVQLLLSCGLAPQQQQVSPAQESSQQHQPLLQLQASQLLLATDAPSVASPATSSSNHTAASVRHQQSKTWPPSVLLRYRPADPAAGVVRVYPGRLDVRAGVTSAYCELAATSDTSAEELMLAAIDRFGLESDGRGQLNRFRLVEVSFDRGSTVHERTMDNAECPWELVKNAARESVRRKHNTRFYLRFHRDEGAGVAVYVGNLPPNLSQKQYEQTLLELLGKPFRFRQMNPIYYEHGSCVLTYDNADMAVKAFHMLRESVGLVVLLLPNIAPEMIPRGVRPLLVFVNAKSGGCKGSELLAALRRQLNPYQVYDLENGGPLPGLYVFRQVRDYKILVSGGDGSVGWVLQCLDNVGQDSECQSPPCAIIPLGTGNDLARVLRWGSGFTGAEDPSSFLKDIIDAEEVILDRWTVVFHADESAVAAAAAAAKQDQSAVGGAEDNAAILVMNNYLGIGLDADLCLGFHNAREENPDKFNSRLHNKGVYVKQAIRKMVNRVNSCNHLNKAIRLEVDGRQVALPHVEGIIVLNILSWGSGANPWGPEADSRFARPTHFDGMLEVVGVTGIVHMGQIQSGLSRAIRIAQGGRIKIRLNSEVPVQVDGEPWVQSPCEVNILRSALKATMLRKTKMKRRNTEPTLNQEPSDVGVSVARLHCASSVLPE